MQKPAHNLPNSQGGAQQQNISINISYNLNTTKIPKSILAQKKQTSKTKKVHTPVMHSIGNQFFSNMGFNSLNQGKKSIKKQNLSKKSNQSSIPAKEAKSTNQKKIATKKKKTKQNNITQPKQSPTDDVIQYYNPLANNSKHFLKRNIQSPDIFKVEQNRKIKTQASNYQPIDSTFKKLKRSTGNSKQTHSGLIAKNTKINNFLKDTGFNFIGHKIPSSINFMLKKPSGSSKVTKNRKSSHQIKQKQKRMYTQQNENITNNQIPQTRHNKSCMLYSTKKQGIITQPNLIQAAQHIMSTYVSTNSNKMPRKRAQSAYAFSKNGKELVSKLLNMSIISSELGSSQLISSQRMKSGRNDLTRKKLGLKVDEFDQFNHYQPHAQPSETQNNKIQTLQSYQQVLPGNALRQYLNSIDLRIIKNIEDDTANIAVSQPQKVEKNTVKSQKFDKDSFSLNIGSNRTTQRQRQQSTQNNSDVVLFYNKLFSNALNNKRIQEEQQKYLDSANLSSERKSLSIDLNQPSKLKKEKFIIQDFNDQDQSGNQKSESKNADEQIYEFVQSSKPEGPRKLNFQHYKELLNKQVQKQIKQPAGFDFQLMSCENQFDFVSHKGQTNKSQEIMINKDIQKLQGVGVEEKAIIDQIDESFKPSQSPSSGSSLSQFKQDQVERWNSLNQIMSLKINTNHLNQTMKNDFTYQLSNQSLLNNWINQKQPQPSEQQSDLISQQTMQIEEKTVFFKKEALKSPKHSNRQKFTGVQAEYNQVCWQYNAEQLDKQIQNYHQQQNQISKKQSNNVFNSPNNFSQEGNGSGDEEYDSKKYSQVSIYKDNVVEDKQSSLIQEGQSNTITQKQHSKNSPVGSLQDEEEEDLSFEEKEIHSDNRWINSNFQGQIQSDDPQNRIRMFMQKIGNQQESKPNQDYLDCDLSSFGVKNIPLKEAKTNQELQKTGLLNEPSQSIQPAKAKITNQDFTIMTVQKSQAIQSHFKLTINGKQTQQKITLQVSNEKKDAFSEIRRKRLTHIVEDIILQMIRQFAKDISYILKKSSNDKRTQQQFEENTSPFRSYAQHHQEQQLSPFSKQTETFDAINTQTAKKQQLKKSQFVGKCFGIDTSFISVQKYLKQFKEYLLKDQNMKQHIIKNINKDIGPNSLEILSYLRPQYDNIDSHDENELEGHQERPGQQDNCQDEDGLFVVPSEAFSQFQNYLEQKIQEKNKQLQPQQQTILTHKQKRNTNFWHRGIYQSWNQFLDYERPYGINGKPYQWVKQRKKFRQVQIEEVQNKLQKGIDKLLQGISLPSGIIYDKYDLPPMYMDLNEQQKIYLNEQRLSRMLAIELFESEQTWINYNDEMAQLLVQLSRIIEDRIFFQMTTQMKKTFRKRNLLTINGKINEGSQPFQENNEPEYGEEQIKDNNWQQNDHKWLVEQAEQQQG